MNQGALKIKLLNIDELLATRLIPLPKSTVRRLARTGKIRAYKPGKEWLFILGEVLEDIKLNFKNNHGNTQTKKKPQNVGGRLQARWR